MNIEFSLRCFDAKPRRISRRNKKDCDKFATPVGNLQSNATSKGK